MSHTLSPQNPVVTDPREDTSRPCEGRRVTRISGVVRETCTTAATNTITLLCPHGHLFNLDLCLPHIQQYLTLPTGCRACRSRRPDGRFTPLCCYVRVQAVA